MYRGPGLAAGSQRGPLLIRRMHRDREKAAEREKQRRRGEVEREAGRGTERKGER